MPILWHLALMGNTTAMVELSSELGRTGRIGDRFSQSGLAYAAYRKGNSLGAEHLAMGALYGKCSSGMKTAPDHR
jgi:hypothetical protein